MTEQKPKARRGIYLLPNLFTTAALFAGFYAIVASMNDRFEAASIAIFVAMVLDGMDGRIARMTNTQSDFGAQYDSLSDMISFGLAPSLVMYQWSLSTLGKAGWLAAFVYASATALRLARFNTQVGIADKRYFQGLASPAAAALMAGLVWLSTEYELREHVAMAPVCFVITVLAGLLMVSNIRYNSFKELDLKGKVPFFTVLVIVMGFALISVEPSLILSSIALVYASSGPVLTLTRIREHREARRVASSEDDAQPPEQQ